MPGGSVSKQNESYLKLLKITFIGKNLKGDSSDSLHIFKKFLVI